MCLWRAGGVRFLLQPARAQCLRLSERFFNCCCCCCCCCCCNRSSVSVVSSRSSGSRCSDVVCFFLCITSAYWLKHLHCDLFSCAAGNQGWVYQLLQRSQCINWRRPVFRGDDAEGVETLEETHAPTAQQTQCAANVYHAHQLSRHTAVILPPPPPPPPKYEEVQKSQAAKYTAILILLTGIPHVNKKGAKFLTS